MNVQQKFNARSNTIRINDFSNIKIGKNIMTNILGIFNNDIKLDWLNGLILFKIKSKKLYLMCKQMTIIATKS